MKKEKLRQQQLQLLKQHPTNQLELNQLYQQLFKSGAWQQAQVVGLTISLPGELNTQPMIAQAWAEGKKVVLPVIDLTTKQMTFHEYKPATKLVKVAFNLLEPTGTKAYQPNEINLLVVPGLLFNQEKQRIGFGGGFYDRYCANYPGVTVALADQKRWTNKIWPIAPTDLPLTTIFHSKQSEELADD